MLATMNVYENMSLTTSGSARIDGLKQSFCARFDYDPGVCALTQVRGIVTLAHLLPMSSRRAPSVLDLLQLTVDNLNDPGYLLLLASGIKQCFDRLQLSFVPSVNEEFVGQFVLKIWDNNIREKAIFDKSEFLIGSFEDRPITFNRLHAPCRRVLAYQSLWACSKYLGGSFTEGFLPYRIDSLDAHHQEMFMSLVRSRQGEFNAALIAEGQDELDRRVI
jgi:hypothetical protein